MHAVLVSSKDKMYRDVGDHRRVSVEIGGGQALYLTAVVKRDGFCAQINIV